MWTCPDCGRTFKNTHQDHSCEVTPLEAHFVNKQQNVIDSFHTLKTFVMTFEGVSISSVKNAVLFTATTHFLAAKPKKRWLDIEFVLNEALEGFPIHKTVQASKNKWAHFVRLERVEDIDEELKEWLRRAWEVSSK